VFFRHFSCCRVFSSQAAFFATPSRNSIPQFLSLRAMRIFPALAVEVIVSAVVLGLLVTRLPIGDYLSSPLFHAYFLTILGDIQFTLPGVFDGRPINLQLWTIPFELDCYICLVILSLLGIVRRRGALGALIIAAALIMTIAALHGSTYHKGWNVPGRMLVLSFLFGVAGYLFKSVLPYRASLFWASVVAIYIFLNSPNLVFLAAAPLAYATIYLGLKRLPPIPFGDLSYGVYLFHFPIARALFETTGRVMPWQVLLPSTVVLTMAFAALSWRFVEKPILDRKAVVLAFMASATEWVAAHRPRFRARVSAPVEALDYGGVSEAASPIPLGSPSEPRP
jgi:peptidoglycan/LPS O-acetylase OafA/YrhL